ncbi:MAG: hypothetical protein WC043_08000 [Pseudobdellovibrionaceae bacterium]
MKELCTAFLAASLYSAFTIAATATAEPNARVDIANPNSGTYSAIKQLVLEDNGFCTLQFASSRKVATTAAHCLDLIILGDEKFAAVKGADGTIYAVTHVYIPDNYAPRDTSNKMYADKAIVVLDRPVSGLVNRFEMRALHPEDFYRKGSKGGSKGERLDLTVEQAGFPFYKYGTLSGNMNCTLSTPQIAKNGKDYVVHHNCQIAPGESGSAVWDKKTNEQVAIITSLNYAIPLTETFINAYETVARAHESMISPQRPSGFIKVGYQTTAAQKRFAGIEVHHLPM